MSCQGTRKCLNCRTFFKPHPRSKGRQKYCSQPACQTASKRTSEKKWVQKPQNRTYFQGPENVQRVQQWRAKNPGYSKRQAPCPHNGPALQETLTAQDIEKHKEKTDRTQDALQDLLIAQPVVLIGLIAHLTGSTLQDDIVRTGRKLRELGEDFLHKPKKEPTMEQTLSSPVLPNPKRVRQIPPPIQLDRSATGA